MSRVAVPVTFLAMILAVLLWAAGVVPASLLWRVEIGLAAALLFAAALAAWREILRKKRPTVGAANSYIVVTASERIDVGDLVVIESGKARRAVPRHQETVQ